MFTINGVFIVCNKKRLCYITGTQKKQLKEDLNIYTRWHRPNNKLKWV